MSSNSEATQEVSGTKSNNSMASGEPGRLVTEDVTLSTSNTTDWPVNQPLGVSLLHLFENQLWTDVSFRCQGHGVEKADDRIKAHKVILAARSPVFRAMFYGPSADGKEEQELNTVEAQPMYLPVRYMYSESTELTEAVAPKVMKLAQLYQISGLISYCAKYLKSVLRADNACEILELALFYNTHDLRDAACEVIDQKAEEVLQSDGFMQSSETCLTYILKGDTFYADEVKAFHAAIKWSENKLQEKSLNKDGTEKRKMLGEAFYFLRIPSMPVKDFIKCTKGEGYYSLAETEDIIQHMSEDVKDVSSVVCHSAVKRLPLHQDIAVEQQQSSPQTNYTNILDSLLLLKVFKDCSLNRVSLQDVTPFNIITNDSTNPKVSYQRANNNRSIFLSGTLAIDDIFSMEFRFIPSDNREIVLTEPVNVKKRDAPYKLHLRLTLNTVQGMTLCAMNNSRQNYNYSSQYCEGVEHTEACLKSLERATSHGAIRYAYCRNSAHVNFMKSISVRNASNRS